MLNRLSCRLKSGAMVVYDYKRDHLVRKTEQSTYRVGSCVVVGVLLEAILKLLFKPLPGKLPVPIVEQAHSHHPSVTLTNVLAPGKPRAGTVTIGATAADVELAKKLALGVIQKVTGDLALTVLAADHTNDRLGSGARPHDLLCSGGPQGLYSVEVKCREVESRTAFDWQGTLQREARPLWERELTLNRDLWKARVLIFIELPRPCHSGSHHIHGSILRKTGDWEVLFGWRGFKQGAASSGPAGELDKQGENVKEQAKSKESASAPAVPAEAQSSQPDVVVRQPALSERQLETRWQAKLKNMEAEGEWIRLSAFLSELREPAGHPQRHVEDQSSKKLWWLGIRYTRAPREGVDWCRRSGKRGGGAGSVGAKRLGPIYGRVAFLKEAKGC